MTNASVCIIGGGICALPCIKACLEEGLKPVCYEMTGDIGGRWNVRKFNDAKTHSTMTPSCLSTSSKEMMAFSDYPPDAALHNFMGHAAVNQYLHKYAEHYDLLKHIVLNTEVVRVVKADDYDVRGAWRVTLGSGQTIEYDHVMLASGIHSKVNMPNVKGLHDVFNGKVIHSQQYEGNLHYRQKQNILIIGCGNTSAEIATDLAPYQSRVFVSTRSGAWIRSRVSYGLRGKPDDIARTTRANDFARTYLPSKLVNEEYAIDRNFNHFRYGLRPSHAPGDRNHVTCDQTGNNVISGQVQYVDDVKRFNQSSAVLLDGTTIEVDLVICATGYTTEFAFVHPRALLPVKENTVDAYLRIFPSNLARDTMAIIGMVEPNGAISPIAELQARLAARVFARRVALPSKGVRAEYIAELNMEKRPTLQADVLHYSDELASLIGCKPSIVNTLLACEPSLCANIVFGANVPYVYRLEGPHSWTGARKAITELKTRVWTPLASRKTKKHSCMANKYDYNNMAMLFNHFVRLLFIIVLTVGSTFALSAVGLATHSAFVPMAVMVVIMTIVYVAAFWHFYYMHNVTSVI